MSLSECVDLAHMGKNYFLIAKLGYSPHQVVFGVSLVMTSVNFLHLVSMKWHQITLAII